MDRLLDPVDCALLDDWQRDFPITERPFGVLAQQLGVTEQEVLIRLRRQIKAGRVTRVGATCAPNTISASTLAAVAAPEEQIEKVAAIINDEPGINHSYLRENEWNLWFVATGPDRQHVDAALARIGRRSGLRVLDLRLVRPFNLDLGFAMRGKTARSPMYRPPDTSVLKSGDRDIMQALLLGLPLEIYPYRALADQLEMTHQRLLERLRILVDAGIVARFGVIVRHRALGWRSNAMVVWNLSSEAISEAGPALARQPGVTLCYERRPVDGVWPYRLYSMIHARSRADALHHLENAAQLPELAGVEHLALFSSHCFKQTGAMISGRRRVA